jgi:hypothetical protein
VHGGLCYAVRQKKCNKEGKEPKALLELPPSFFELELFSFFHLFFSLFFFVPPSFCELELF